MVEATTKQQTSTKDMYSNSIQTSSNSSEQQENLLKQVNILKIIVYYYFRFLYTNIIFTILY